MAETQTPNQATVIYDDKAMPIARFELEGEDLWLGLSELRLATGWELKPEGVCRGELCVPIPEGKSVSLIDNDRNYAVFNLTAFARYIEQPYAYDDKHNLWVFGPQASEWRNRLLSASAPDFTLPDLEGNLYSLSDFRGRKVLLAFWSSW